MPARLRLIACALAAASLTACTSSGGDAPPPPDVSIVAPPATRSGPLPNPATPRTSSATTRAASSSPSASVTRTPRSRPRPGQQLPLRLPTYDARQVITVVADAESDVRAVVQTWHRVAGGWRQVGPAVAGWLGTDGMTPHPSEQLSAVPMGSYTLTQAFGHDPDPGTRLPYTRTDPSSWWISQSGPLYNTLQHCATDCPFTQGDPNEHLYFETPYYDYAAVIDYNTRNAGPVRQGGGSAFFLHVAVGAPTQGCVSIPKQQLVRVLRWLRPADHPRILIGTR